MFTSTTAFFKKTRKQRQQNVLLRGTGPHINSSIARREIS